MEYRIKSILIILGAALFSGGIYLLSIPLESGFTTYRNTILITFWLVAGWIMVNIRKGEVKYNRMNILRTIIVGVFSIIIVYGWDERVLINQYPLAQILYPLPGFIMWFIAGFVITTIMVMTQYQNREQIIAKGMTYPFIALGLGVVITFILSVAAFNSGAGIGTVYIRNEDLIFPLNYLLPVFGEGTEGSIFIISIMWMVYMVVRYPNATTRGFTETFSLNTGKDKLLAKQQLQSIAYLGLEAVTSFAAASAAFSLLGLLINDGIPQLSTIATPLIIISFLATIPYSIMTSVPLTGNMEIRSIEGGTIAIRNNLDTSASST